MKLTKFLKSLREPIFKKMKIIFNPAPFTTEVLDYPLEKVDTIIYNETEGKGLSGYEKIHEIKSNLLKKYPNLKQILTLGNQGAIYFDKKTQKYQLMQ